MPVELLGFIPAQVRREDGPVERFRRLLASSVDYPPLTEAPASPGESPETFNILEGRKNLPPMTTDEEQKFLIEIGMKDPPQGFRVPLIYSTVEAIRRIRIFFNHKVPTSEPAR